MGLGASLLELQYFSNIFRVYIKDICSNPRSLLAINTILRINLYDFKGY